MDVDKFLFISTVYLYNQGLSDLFNKIKLSIEKKQEGEKSNVKRKKEKKEYEHCSNAKGGASRKLGEEQ